MTPRIPHFKTETFELPATYLDPNGVPKSLVGVTVLPSLHMTGSTLLLTALITDILTGAYVILATPAQTALWLRGVWPLRVTYEQTILGAFRREIDDLARIVVEDMF